MPEPENKELLGVLLERIQQKGTIPFVEFMDLVLYHPQHGYYNSPKEKIGPRGDYYTSSSVHPGDGGWPRIALLGHPPLFPEESPGFL
jgi:hypothetical protein